MTISHGAGFSNYEPVKLAIAQTIVDANRGGLRELSDLDFDVSLIKCSGGGIALEAWPMDVIAWENPTEGDKLWAQEEQPVVDDACSLFTTYLENREDISYRKEGYFFDSLDQLIDVLNDFRSEHKLNPLDKEALLESTQTRRAASNGRG